MTKLTAYGQDEEPWRIERLETLLNAISMLFKSAPVDGFAGPISMHDHKGDLDVHFGDDINDEEMDLIRAAWAVLDGTADNVTFYCAGHEVGTEGYYRHLVELVARNKAKEAVE